MAVYHAHGSTAFYCRWDVDDATHCEDADGFDAMKLGLETWAEWVSSRVNPVKQRVFFVTMSPTHLW